jgi:hypothetical protein
MTSGHVDPPPALQQRVEIRWDDNACKALAMQLAETRELETWSRASVTRRVFQAKQRQQAEAPLAA